MTIDGSLPLDEAYFQWLIDQTVLDGDVPLTDHVFRVLYKTPFEVLIPRDENRAAEGIALRSHFLDEVPSARHSNLQDWLELECSIFEMLLALAFRAGYQTGDYPAWWFSIFVDNLGLGPSPSKAAKAIKRLNRREYDYSGYGGLFPLQSPETDQRETELWYQLAAYIIENGLY